MEDSLAEEVATAEFMLVELEMPVEVMGVAVPVLTMMVGAPYDGAMEIALEPEVAAPVAWVVLVPVRPWVVEREPMVEKEPVVEGEEVEWREIGVVVGGQERANQQVGNGSDG